MLDKVYDASKYEQKIQDLWEKEKVFKPIKSSKWTHINILPPPNANGQLHLWHASWYTIMDIAGRFARMQWKETLLLPWKDHAWILTQVVFERKLKSEHWIDKQNLWREEFYKRCYDFCSDSSDVMRAQEKRIWISADWDREKFTLDPKISKRVIDTFIKMYNDWIAYKWNRIINWCPNCMTALSDMEVEHKDDNGKIWELKYPIKGSKDFIVVATTRPETMLWDSAVAVNTKDKRYTHLIWQIINLPIVNREIKVIADDEVDMEFWSWAVKVTPAHDPLDYEIWKRHWLDEISVIWKDWLMTSETWNNFEWKSALSARSLVVDKFRDLWLLKSEKDYVKPLSLHDRCSGIIEPIISEQWWIDVDHESFSLKNEAIKAVKSWKIKIVPKHFEKTFFNWMENLNHWCISRQIWWGHRIPAWYKNWEIKVQAISPWEWWIQDEDTFDTWFSSWQWAYNTVWLFWEDKKYFPWDFMVMWRDILFFWACRMIMFSLYTNKQVPFSTLYLTWLIKDRNGTKMSKSKWNWIDPLEMADKYWTDALRLSLFIGNSPWNDMRLYEEKIKWYRNFVNKLWNASRFVQLQLFNNLWIKCTTNVNLEIDISKLTQTDKWILTSLQRLIHEVTHDVDDFQYSNAGQKLYDFCWSEFCDWYLELSKWENQNINVLVYVLWVLLKLMHPFIPFVTEAIYFEIFWNKQAVALMSWPVYQHDFIFKKSLNNVGNIISCIKAVRNIKIDLWIDASKKVSAKINSSDSFLVEHRQDIIRLWRLESLEIWNHVNISDDLDSIVPISSTIIIWIPKASNIDKQASEDKRLKSIIDFKNKIENLEKRLSNQSYLDRAPDKLVAQSNEELEEYRKKLVALVWK